MSENIYVEIEERVELLQTIVERGNTEAAGALRHLAAMPGLINALSGNEGEIVARAVIDLADSFLAALQKPSACVVDPLWERRARLLAADAMEIGFTEEGHYEFNQVCRLQHEARRLLTGIDEGPYVPDTESYQSRSTIGQSRS